MKKILFIEDEPTLQKTLEAVLEADNFKMVSATDGESGLRLAHSEKPDLIILDLILPGRHGLDVLKNLKEDNATKDIPVIILTNLEEPKNIETALELGATTYLVKASYSLEEVADKIKKVIQS
ncbi:MAG: response regulator [bacterium]|nr:response regulator [bacterium]